MDVKEILSKLDAGEKISHAEWGELLPELVRLKKLVADRPQYCCGHLLTCFYKFRGKQQFLWVAGHVGHDQAGRTKVPAIAASTAKMAAGFITVTRCRRCGDGFTLVMEADRSISVCRGLPPAFARVAE